MEAILLVGGKGIRLHPLTVNTPKPMLKVGGIPFVAHQIGYAKAHGISRIIIASSYKSEQFQSYLGDGSDFDLEIVYAVEEEPLGTGGAIANAGALLHSPSTEPVAIFNGDILSAHDITMQLQVHRENHADITLQLIRVEDARAYGSVPTDSSGRITAFVEKSETPPTNYINAGCYLFNRSLIDELPRERVSSVEREIFPGLLESGRRLWSYPSESYWLDIGTPSALLKASIDLASGKFHSPMAAESKHMRALDGALIDSAATIAPSARITSGSAVGASRIEESVVIHESMIGDGVLVAKGSQISHSIIGDGVSVGAGAELVGVVIAGPEVVIAANSRHLGELQ